MLARSALWSPDKSCYSQTVLLVQRLHFFKTTCPSVLLDDFGTWIITKDMAVKLNTFATSCCRIMLNIKCLHKVSNHRVYDLNGISQLSCCGMATFCAWRRMDQLTFYFVRAHELAMFLLEWILGYTGKPSLTDLTVATMLHHEVKTG